MPRVLGNGPGTQTERVTAMGTTVRQQSDNLVAQLRALADDIESGRLPYPGSVSLYTGWLMEDGIPEEWDTEGRYAYPTWHKLTMDDVRAIMARTPGGWRKDIYGPSITYTRKYGSYSNNEVTVCFEVNREEQCTRVQTGTRHVEEVPAVPAHDEPVYEWQCAPDAPDAPDVEEVPDTSEAEHVHHFPWGEDYCATCGAYVGDNDTSDDTSDDTSEGVPDTSAGSVSDLPYSAQF